MTPFSKDLPLLARECLLRPLKEIEAVKMPGFDESKRSDPAYSDSFNQQRNQALQERADLQAKFIATYPDYPKIAEVRRERWMNL